MSNTLESTILEHAESLNLELNGHFIEAVRSGVKNLGVLNPKIPNAFVQAAVKTLSPKLKPGSHLPGINAFSVPVCQKYDYAGGYAGYFRAFRFLVSPFAFNGTHRTIIDDVINDGPASHALGVIVGSDWASCVQAIKEHLSRAMQSPFVDKGEKQVFWKTGEKHLVVTPLADTLPAELQRRIAERKTKGQFLQELYHVIGGEKFQNSGVMATVLGGTQPKLMSLPPLGPREVTPLPASTPGQFLALEFTAQDMNATGSSVMGGLANVTAALGFAEALRLTLSNSGVEITPGAVALGFSNVDFHGRCERGIWSYSVKKGYRDSAGKDPIPFIDPEITATARVHIIMKIDEMSQATTSSVLDSLPGALHSLRFSSGSIFNAQATITSDLEEFMDDWGDRVWFVADRQSEIEGASDKLDAALDCLVITEQNGGDWLPAKPDYALAAIGYQAIEPPRPRNGLRDPDCRHVYAAGTVGLMQWVRASECASDAIFWSESWNRVTYSCLAKSQKN